MRGKRVSLPIRSAKSGITPAGAGKTFLGQPRRRIRKDHPRRCGENRTDCYDVRLRKGSPPQVRGKQIQCRRYSVHIGITPAGAGKTKTALRRNRQRRDHPRRCGENRDGRSVRRWNRGSPPQVRGKPLCAGYCVHIARITPAGAGKTVGVMVAHNNTEDHPRRCGENSSSSIS